MSRDSDFQIEQPLNILNIFSDQHHQAWWDPEGRVALCGRHLRPGSTRP